MPFLVFDNYYYCSLLLLLCLFQMLNNSIFIRKQNTCCGSSGYYQHVLKNMADLGFITTSVTHGVMGRLIDPSWWTH